MKNWKIRSFFKTNVNSKESVYSKHKQIKLKFKYVAEVFKQFKTIRTTKILKPLRRNEEKMSVRVNVRISKIMRTPIKVGVRMYTTYANCPTVTLSSKLGFQDKKISGN